MAVHQSRRRPAAGDDQPGCTVAAEVPGLAARQAAVRLLAAVVDARTPLDGLTDPDHGHPQFRALPGRDRALVRAILATALRFRGTIDSLVAARLDRPLPANARTLSHVLHVAAAQLLFLDVPDSAAVDLAVTQARLDPRTTRFASLVNAVLREMARRKERALPAALAQSLDAPAWIAGRLHDAYGPVRAAAILAAHREEAPLDLTVKADPSGWAAGLGGVVVGAGTVRLAASTGPVTGFDGFETGAWWVQDAAASLPVRLLGDVSGLRVADLCAAPGGKTAQLAAAGAHVTAVDSSVSRLKRLAANLERLRLQAEIVQADVRNWMPEMAFDAVLLDAPCSATGTARRHPDVLWTKSPEDVGRLAALQATLLERAVSLVRPGGLVVYANCSLDPAEGEALVTRWLSDHPNNVLERVEPGALAGLAHLVSPDGYLRTTPADGMDGFFAVRLRRLA